MSSPLNATPKSTTANSYLTVGRANSILRRRLYTDSWDNASAVPSADGYYVNGAASSGASSVTVDTGSGTFSVGTIVSFEGHDQEYTVTAALSGAGSLAISPALVAGVSDNTPVSRLTASSREKALMWATQLLDAMMQWYGTKRTNEQSLWFPATGLVDENGMNYDFDTIPAILEVATAELAQHLLTRDVFKLPAALVQGVVEAQIGPLKAKIDDKQQIAVIPENILSLLSTLGSLESEAQKGSMVVQMRRV